MKKKYTFTHSKKKLNLVKNNQNGNSELNAFYAIFNEHC